MKNLLIIFLSMFCSLTYAGGFAESLLREISGIDKHGFNAGNIDEVDQRMSAHYADEGFRQYLNSNEANGSDENIAEFCKNANSKIKNGMRYKDCLEIGRSTFEGIQQRKAFIAAEKKANEAIAAKREEYQQKIIEQKRIDEENARIASEKAEIERQERIDRKEKELRESERIIASYYEANYGKNLNEALRLSLSAGSTTDSLGTSFCTQAWSDAKAWEHKQEIINRCVDDLAVNYTKSVKMPSYKAINCEQYAIKKGKNWMQAPFDMSYSPLAGKNQEPVMFFGQILDGDSSGFLVFNDRTSINANIAINSQTTIFKQNDIHIKGSVFGYGIKIGSQKGNLVSGAKTTISVIMASCIQPL